MSTAIRQLARACSVVTEYRDGFGERHEPDDEALAAVLRSLGIDVDHPDQAGRALRERRADAARRMIEPVVVAWDGRLQDMPIRTPQNVATVTVAVFHENGEMVAEQTLRSCDDTGDAHRAFLCGCRDGGCTVSLDMLLPFGYHTLQVETGSRRQTAVLISAPRRCPRPVDRAWGAFLPLYALRSAPDWGIGDLGGLGRLQRWLAESGARYVATLPLFAAFLGESGPFEASPYLPVSRLFWNQAYLDLEMLPESRSDTVARLLDAHPIVVEREALQRLSHVDYRRVERLKRRIITECATALSTSEQRHAAFHSWLVRDPARMKYARFRAACERYGAPRAPWPRHGRVVDGIPQVDANAVLYHAYAQWAMTDQLAALSSDGGVDIALDLPLGVHPEGFDVWHRPSLYARHVHVGSPPDSFMPKGQEWGFHPLHPSVSRSTGHRYLRECIRTLMERCGMVRLDHVMGLHRQFFVPSGCEPRSGTYVTFPAEELYALVCLEAMRTNTVVVGEDLGTVPGCVRKAMDEHGVLRTYVLQTAGLAAGGTPHLPDNDSLAVLGTHDMSTFAGFWHDTDLRRSTAHQEVSSWTAAELGRRDALRERIAAIARCHTRDVAGHPEALLDRLRAALWLLGRSDAAVVIANLEDLWLEPEPQNVPGAADQAASWRRRARVGLEDLEGDPDVRAMLQTIDRARREAAA